MRCPVPRLSLLLLPLLTLAWSAHAGVTLRVDGVDDTLKAAVVDHADLSQYVTRDVTAAQIRRLYERAPAQVQSALEPYGYYDATTQGELTQNGTDWIVTLHVKQGEPVKITAVDLQLDATAMKVRPVQFNARKIEALKGQVLNDGTYTTLKDDLSAALTAHGFLGAKLITHQVLVTRADHNAVVKLAWQAGPRYRFGQVNFEGSQFVPGFLQRYVPFKQGDYFSQAELLALQQSLNGADYFSVVNVLPDVNDASGGIVDVNVQLKPALRTIYTGGVFVGTDTGAGVQAGVERRWINKYGHKWKNSLVAAQRLKTLSSVYIVPLGGPDQRSFNFGVNLRDANLPTSKSRTIELVANETRLWHGWTRELGVHALSGTFTVGQRNNEPVSDPGIERGTSTLVYAQASLSRKKADNPAFVRHGWRMELVARSTAGSLLSTTRLTEVSADAKWIQAFWGNNRLILRGSVGVGTVGDFTQLPPQLRFFAGGDQSIRGYAYQTVGPRNSYGRVIGGKDLLVASTTVEHYFTRNWGMAAFVDAGNAFNNTSFSPAIGAGLGVRWRSPVGMVRLDLGTPIHNQYHSGIELHLVIGPDL
ncbi:MAG: autotransporter assembly complex family protein [Rhodanobacter sp.]